MEGLSPREDLSLMTDESKEIEVYWAGKIQVRSGDQIE